MKAAAIIIPALFLVSCQKIVIQEKEVIVEKHDTTYVDVHDTSYVVVTDTLYIQDPSLYDWEQGRYIQPELSDIALCYGGSALRTSTDWPKERFAEYVSYKDTSGVEHWLFDSFLALEWRYVDMAEYDPSASDDPLDIPGKYCLTGGHDYRSSPKKGWQYMLDFWFDDDNGFGALDKAVGEAASRMGDPGYRHRIIMFLPDPMINERYNDSSSSSVYWGEVEGRQLDFSKDSDRLAAYRWYIDLARKKFDEKRKAGQYGNIELVGFYILSEDIKHPSESWTDYARLYGCIPALAEYLHKANEYLYWIPYSSAPGRCRGWDLGIDYIWLQPNYYEHGGGYLDTALDCMINDGLGMEIEFDRKALYRFNGTYPNTSTYRSRFLSYMSGARSRGLYGERPFTYYMMTDMKQDVLLQMRTSSYSKDQELYQQFCAFVSVNPLKDNLK